MAAMTNEEVLITYKARFDDWFMRYFLPHAQGKTPPEPSQKDGMLMLEFYHIMVEYKRDPFKPLVQTKLAYDPWDYAQVFDAKEMLENMRATVKWWTEWKPGALFV